MLSEAIEYEEGTAMLREIEKEEKRPLKPQQVKTRREHPTGFRIVFRLGVDRLWEQGWLS